MPEFSQEIFDAVCERIAEGESLRSISGTDGLPNAREITRWLDQNPDLVPQYARARERQADKLFEEILHIADTPVEGEKRKILPNGQEEITYGDMIEHRRLQVDARKWMAGKLRPKVYGDKVALGGAEDLPPIKTEDVSARDLLKAHLDAITSRTSGQPE